MTSPAVPPTASSTVPPVPPGMGAVVHDGGVAFRVWAPHATAVHVKGTFNDWSDTAHPLRAEGNGYWAADVAPCAVGAEYKFRLDVEGGEALERIDPYARVVTSSVGSGVVYDPAAFDWEGDAFEMPPHHRLVIYEMHIGSFLAPIDGAPGNFQTAAQKLDHLQRLGINAIEVMPVAEFAGDYSWGYNPAQVFAVESAYGGPDAFKQFVREAHRRGIAVILDVVYNHFGPSDLDLWRFDGWHENDKGGIYFYNDHRSSTPWGDTRPDYSRGEVRQFIRDNALMWLTECHVDGLRLDMTLYLRTIRGEGGDDLPEAWNLMQWVNTEVRERHPTAIMIAEDLRTHPGITLGVAEGGAGFHAQWDANFVHPVRAAVIVPEDGQRSMEAVRDAIAFRYNDDAFQRVVYSESHDEVANGKARVPQEVNPDDATGWFAQKRSALAAALVFSAPGIPMIFQGQEFLQGEWFRDDVPIDWNQSEAFGGIVRMYRDLIRLRLNAGGFTAGLCGQFCHVSHVNDALNMIAFQRADQHGPGDDVLVVLNFAAEPREGYELGVPAAGVWRVRFNSDSTHYSADFGNQPCDDLTAAEGERDGLPAVITLGIAPYSVLILSQDMA